MKIVNQKTHVKVDGVETKQFGIIFDRHMVNILSNQLYEDKVLAIVRELSTNALDSQREAGCADRPFDVQMPTWSKMEFSIRDYGVGMSPDKIDNIYRNYGASDRNESNDFTGCMGLGSKTPFCYHTRTFTVDSWYNGVHYQYACFLDEDGMPQIAQTCSQPSDEESGVKITLPVNSSDRHEFEVAVEEIYKFFDVTPNISVKIEKPSYTLQDGNWKYDENGDRNMRIIMGNVAYSVNEYSIGDLTPSQRRVVNTAFHVYVPIGDVGVTASREGLDYTNRTKTHIRGYVNNIISSFNQKAQDDISQCKNLWEARLRFLDYEKSNLSGVFDAAKIVYNGKKLFDTENHIDCSQMIKAGKVILNSFEYSSWRNPERKNVNTIYVRSNPKLFVNDLKVGGFVRAIDQVKTHQRSVLLITFKDDSYKQEFCDLLGLDESYFTDISTIPSPTQKGTRTSRGKTTKVLRVKQGQVTKLNSYHWANVEKDLNDGGVYVEFNRFAAKLVISGSKKTVNMAVIQRYISILQGAGIQVPEIYGIKTAVLPSIKNKTNWKDFWTWAIEQVNNSIKNVDLDSQRLYKDELDSLGYRGYNSRHKMDINTLVDIAKHCDWDTELKQFVDKVVELKKLASDTDNLEQKRRMCEVFGIKIPSTTLKPLRMVKEEDKMYEKYRLLKLFKHDSDPVHVAYYINAVG